MLEQMTYYRRQHTNQQPTTEDGEKRMKATTRRPEMLRFEDIETPDPGEGQVLMKAEVASVDYARAALRLAQESSAATSETETPGSSEHPSCLRKRWRPNRRSRDA